MPLLINGTDLATTLAALGVFIDSTWDGDLDPAIGAPATRPVVGDFGERLTGAPGIAAARTLHVDAYLTAATPAALELAKDVLVSTCAGGGSGPSSAAVTIALVPSGGGNGRQYTGYLAAPTKITRLEPVGLATWAKVSLSFTCPDPRAYDTSVTTVALSTTNTHCAVGTAPSRPLITLDGPFSAAIIDYKLGNLTPRGTITITGVAASGEHVEIDCALQSVVHIDGSGNRTPRNTWLTAGNFFALDPADIVAGANPVIQIGGTGTATYHKAWR